MSTGVTPVHLPLPLVRQREDLPRAELEPAEDGTGGEAPPGHLRVHEADGDQELPRRRADRLLVLQGPGADDQDRPGDLAGTGRPCSGVVSTASRVVTTPRARRAG